MKLLKKLFIKNYRNTSSPEVRNKYGIVAGLVGLISNVILFAVGIFAGIISGSITIIVESVANLTDAASSVLTLVGFKISSKPADKEHPYGHARIEYIMGFIISLIMLLVGVTFIKSCIEKIFTPEDISINWIMYLILGLIILGKTIQAIIYFDFGKSIKSTTLKTSGVDAINDILTTLAVLVSIIIMDVFNINIDGYVGLVVSIVIIISAIKMIKTTINPLISVKPSKVFVKKIKKELLSFEGVNSFHDLLVHSYGPSSIFATVHIEIPTSTTLLQCHELIDKIERHFEDELNINLTIQIDPVDVDNEVTKAIQAKMTSTLKKLNPKLKIHGLRVVYGNNVNKVFFDILEDFDSNLTKEEISKVLEDSFNTDKTKYNFIFTIDKPFT